MENRKTVKEWRKAWRDSIAKTQKIENEIKLRLKDLCTTHPEIVVGTKADADRTPIKAKEVMNLTKIDGMQTSTRLAFIEMIEKALADAHPHKQGDLFLGHKKSENAVRIVNPETKDKRDV